MYLREIERVLVEWATLIPEIEAVYLFGSRIKGTHDKDSDIDIAIEFDQQAISGVDDSHGLATWFLNKEKWHSDLQSKILGKVHIEWYHAEKTRTVFAGLNEASKVVYRKTI